MSPRPRADIVLLAGLVVAGAALRYSTLGVQSLWFDETVTVDLLHRGLHDMLAAIPDRESTPPLYYLLAWAWARVFGFGEVGLRSLSATLGTAAIPVFYLAARELASRRAALIVAALAAFNPLLIWYSQEARAYSLLALLGGLSLLSFGRLLRRPGPGACAAWAASSALALTTHYFAGFLVLPEAIWLAVRLRGRRDLEAAIGVVALTAAALLPLALHQRSLDLASFIRTGNPLAYRTGQLLKQDLLGFDAPWEVVLTAVAALIALAALASVVRRRPPPGVVAAAALAVAALILSLVLALAGLDYVDTRNLIAGWLPLMVVIGWGLARGRAGIAGTAVLCAIGLAGAIGVAVTPLWQRDDWRGIARALGPAPVARAIVLTPAGLGVLPFEHYRPDARAMPATGSAVEQVALVSAPAQRARQVHRSPPPHPVAPSFSGLKLIRRVYADDYTVLVFASPAPLGLTPLGLSSYGLLRGAATAVLVQQPR